MSTEDEQIVEVSKAYGAEVVKRPQKLARDDSSTIDVIMHVIAVLEGKGAYFDVVVLLEPTSPLRQESDLDNAIGLFIDNIDQADSLVSLGAVHLENPYIMKKVERNRVKPFIEVGEVFYQRQQLPNVYFPYGVIYISKVDALKKYRTFYQERTIPYFIERWQNYEIDDIYDFVCVEAILKYRAERQKEV